VQTSGYIELEELGIAAPGRERYKPVGLVQFWRILPRRSVTADDVFIDIGSGMGRAVLLAATYSFRRVIGVELSTQLVDIAQSNVDRSMAKLRCKDVVMINDDAVQYQIPDDVTVVFMYNPVRGETFAAVVKNILDSYDRRPRKMRIAYGNPIEEPILLSTGRIRLVRHLRGWRPGKDWSRSNSFKMYTVLPG
jgi:SAM-dependent methyltransferase